MTGYSHPLLAYCVARMFVLGTALLCFNGVAAQNSQSAPITLDGNGPYYQLTLPASIYSLTAHSDLRNLRLRNAAGISIPYAWLSRMDAVHKTSSSLVPLFALSAEREGAANDEILLSLKPTGDGSLRLIRRTPAEVPMAARWLMDISGVKGRLLKARFAVAPGTQGLFGYRLRASDDLRQWRSVAGQEQLVILRHDQQTVERLEADLGGIQARYLLLQWSDPRHGATLTSVTVDSVQDFQPLPALEWSDALSPDKCASDTCDYRMPLGAPVHSLRVELAQTNTLGKLHISALADTRPSPALEPHVVRNPLYALRHTHRRPASTTITPTTTEFGLLDTVVYRLTLAEGEAVTPVLPMDGSVHTRLRLQTQGPIAALGAEPPSLYVASPLRSLVFLAQGAPPFTLDWATQSQNGRVTPEAAAGATLPISALLPHFRPDSPLVAGVATIALPNAHTNAQPIVITPAKPTETAPRPHKVWLWGALVIGLLVLAGMAWSLLRRLKQGETPEAVDSRDSNG